MDYSKSISCPKVSLPGIIAKACQFTGAKLIHISTDHFFGNESKRHTEDDDACHTPRSGCKRILCFDVAKESRDQER